jgi:hypothetical protein
LPISGGALNGTGLALAGGTLYPGMIISTTTSTGVLSSSQNYIQSVSASGIYLNNVITASGAGAVMSGTAFAYPIYDTTDTQGSVNSMSALVVNAGTTISGWPSAPTTGLSWINYTHDYNNDVVTVDSLIQQSRPFGSNTLVHQAVFVNLLVNIRIVLSNGYSIPTTQSDIFNQLDTYFDDFSYLGTISFASVAAQILSVAGVANVRINSISTVAFDGTTTATYTKDFLLASNQLPNLYNVAYTITGASNF